MSAGNGGALFPGGGFNGPLCQVIDLPGDAFAGVEDEFLSGVFHGIVPHSNAFPARLKIVPGLFALERPQLDAVTKAR